MFCTAVTLANVNPIVLMAILAMLVRILVAGMTVFWIQKVSDFT